MARKIAGLPATDATIEAVVGSPLPPPISPAGAPPPPATTYHLCYTFGALSIAAQKLHAAGSMQRVITNVNPSEIDADTLPIMLYAGLVTQHPDITFAEASALIDLNNYFETAHAVLKAFVASMERDKKARTKNAQAE